MQCAYRTAKCCHLLTQAVLEVHNNSASEVADEASIIERLGGGAGYEIPTVDPHHDRHRAPQRWAEVHIHWYKDVEVQTVLTDLLGIKYELILVYKSKKKINQIFTQNLLLKTIWSRKKKYIFGGNRKPMQRKCDHNVILISFNYGLRWTRMNCSSDEFD